jgi:hypothetical protein
MTSAANQRSCGIDRLQPGFNKIRTSNSSDHFINPSSLPQDLANPPAEDTTAIVAVTTIDGTTIGGWSEPEATRWG